MESQRSKKQMPIVLPSLWEFQHSNHEESVTLPWYCCSSLIKDDIVVFDTRTPLSLNEYYFRDSAINNLCSKRFEVIQSTALER